MTDTTQTEKIPFHLKIINRIKESTFNNWVLFNSFALFYFIIVFPALYVFEMGILAIVAGILMFLFPILDTMVIFSVAEKNPKSFLKIEKMKRYFTKAFWFLIYLPSVAFVLMILLLPSQFMNDLISSFEPVFIVFIIIFIGASFYQISMVGNVRQQPRMLKAIARASFRVLSDSLEKPSPRKRGKVVRFIMKLFGRKTENEEKWSQIELFENGFDRLNALFINQFNFEFCHPNKYTDYFRFIIWTENVLEIDRVRKVLDVLECTLRSKLKVADILLTTKQILMEKQFITKEELFQDLDFKTGIGRWYNHNKEVIKIGLPLFSLIVSILTLLIRFM